jgi:hypothetical protein
VEQELRQGAVLLQITGGNETLVGYFGGKKGGTRQIIRASATSEERNLPECKTITASLHSRRGGARVKARCRFVANHRSCVAMKLWSDILEGKTDVPENNLPECIPSQQVCMQKRCVQEIRQGAVLLQITVVVWQ